MTVCRTRSLFSFGYGFTVSVFLFYQTGKKMICLNLSFMFFVNNILLGAGLAMDAFSVSLANGLNETHMKKKKVLIIAGVFAAFQAVMPMIGWVCVHTLVEYFKKFEKAVPWIALVLLCVIGGKMLSDGIKNNSDSKSSAAPKLGAATLLLQGVATSIDALSVGFTIADYNFSKAVLCAAIIAAVTFIICISGLIAGKKFGAAAAGKAGILGGIILIAIGIEIFITGII